MSDTHGTAVSAKVAARIAGITYRQLDYWDRIGVVSPSVQARNGSGSRRVYGLTDLYVMRAVKITCDWGVQLRLVRPLATELAHLHRPDEWEGVLYLNGLGVVSRYWMGPSFGSVVGFVIDLGELRADVDGDLMAWTPSHFERAQKMGQP